MNELEQYFLNNEGNLINKWTHFFKVYDTHLSRFRGRPVNLLEIGVRHGGSLQMWKHYFGEDARIFGVDVNPRSRELEESQIEIFVGDQADREFLSELKAQLPPLDIVIDDGGHEMLQQLISFEELFPQLLEDGVYICEDTHTSYWSIFGGGYQQKGTFVERSKELVDELNAWHKHPGNEENIVTDYTRNIESIHFYDCIIAIQKGDHPRPQVAHTGHERIPRYTQPTPAK
jgi:hypothetical protein